MDIPKVSSLASRQDGKANSKSHPQKQTHRPEESNAQQHIDEAVPLPNTPALEKESLPTAAIEDLLLHQSSCEEDREGLSQVQCPDKATTNEDSVSVFPPTLGKKTEIFGAFDQGGFDGGVLCFNDNLDSWLGEEGEVLTSSEGRQISNGGGVTGPKDKMARNEELESGEWYSCSSLASGFGDNWGWNSLLHLNYNESQSFDDKHNLLSWLWRERDDDLEGDSLKLGETDPEKQNAVIASFLS